MDQTATFPSHGGDLAFASARYGIPASEWLDLSTGINPVPYPLPPVAPEAFHRLPDKAGYCALLRAARQAYRVPDRVALIAGPGSEGMIHRLPEVAGAGPVAIVSPTYASHTEAWLGHGRRVAHVATLDAIDDDTAFAVVGNPNNPDGRLHDPAALAALAARLGRRNGFLIVDEAFSDVAPAISLVPHLAGLPAVVLRSLGKFYGLAGVRLGFAAGPDAVLERLATAFGAWPVSGPAIVAGTAALADDAWRDATRIRLRADAGRLRALLSAHRLTVTGGTDLFVAVEDADASEIHARLAGHGIWTRAFGDAPHRLRFGLPDEVGFPRLARALAAPG